MKEKSDSKMDYFVRLHRPPSAAGVDAKNDSTAKDLEKGWK
jgi:hypothetical protein